MDKSTGLFDGVGSIDVSVWKKDGQNQAINPLFIQSLGQSQIKAIQENIQNVRISKPSVKLERLADKYLNSEQLNTNMLPAINGTEGTERNQYRIASISKSFLGYVANYLAVHHGININEKVYLFYLFFELSLNVYPKSYQYAQINERNK